MASRPNEGRESNYRGEGDSGSDSNDSANGFACRKRLLPPPHEESVSN